jgi:flagellum-specific ATP synthase
MVLPDSTRYFRRLHPIRPYRIKGRVSQVIGLVVESTGPNVSVGNMCEIRTRTGGRVAAEVVGFKGNRVLLMPLNETVGIEPGSYVSADEQPYTVGVGRELLGRVLNGLGEPMDGRGPLRTRSAQPVNNRPPDPLNRERVSKPISTGIKTIDGLLTCGVGQRVGIFAGSGVGKSVLLGMMARNTSADVNVIALIGERGREVRDFIERDLGKEGLKRSVVVVVTSEQAALTRVKGAMIATAISEYFAGLGLNVMLMMDSLTRVAMALREVGLAVGEPPTTKGYTPSVFAFLPRLLERAGNFATGSITGMYTVLVESDDMNDPVADTVRSILDGHIVLSRKLAASGHYPAIDVLSSISRVMTDVVPPVHVERATRVKEILSVHRDAEDLINIGAYVHGSNASIDNAVSMIDKIRLFQRQKVNEGATVAGCFKLMDQLLRNQPPARA